MAATGTVTPSSSLSTGSTPILSPIPTEKWETFVNDPKHQSYSYLLRHDDDGENAMMPKNQLDAWFQQLHPSSYTNNNNDDNNNGAWTPASYQNQKLLRQTAWYTLPNQCTCEYGYSDTWQPQITHPKMKSLLVDITAHITRLCGLKDGELNCVNLNYYPRGGGVGYHADDEFLFDGLRREVRIVSLSLCSGGDGDGEAGDVDPMQQQNDNGTSQERNDWGKRKFQIKPKSKETTDKNHSVQEVLLGHGDIMTMEGMFQKYYLHSVWPGDSKEFINQPLCRGERINLTWRTIVRHLDGSFEDCRGLRCPLADDVEGRN
uniref:Fe2OG dioxygenase domain-containing protein n=1 Tax=Helicotheca tamesis TaxID=374047 RepID=A0A7S2IFB1_9STRA